MPLHRRSAAFRDADPRLRNLADELLLYDHQFGIFELRQMTREIALGQSGETLEVEKVSGLARSQRSENREARWFVYETIQFG